MSAVPRWPMASKCCLSHSCPACRPASPATGSGQRRLSRAWRGNRGHRRAAVDWVRADRLHAAPLERPACDPLVDEVDRAHLRQQARVADEGRERRIDGEPAVPVVLAVDLLSQLGQHGSGLGPRVLACRWCLRSRCGDGQQGVQNAPVERSVRASALQGEIEEGHGCTVATFVHARVSAFVVFRNRAAAGRTRGSRAPAPRAAPSPRSARPAEPRSSAGCRCTCAPRATAAAG